MERPIFKPIGTPSEALDTPTLVVDLDAMEANIALVHSSVQKAGARIRPRLDSHLCPAIGHVQIAADAVSGVAVSTLGQAEVFGQHGFGDILLTNLVVTRSKIARAAALARRIKLTIAVDGARNIDDLSAAAGVAGSTIGVAVAVGDGSATIGVVPSVASELAMRITAASDVAFAGLFSAGDAGPVLEAARCCDSAGLPAPMVAAGGSVTYDTAPSDGITDLLAGSYALGENALAQRRPELRAAARILATVISSKDDGLVWLDAGQKATSVDTGLPAVDNVQGADVPRMSAEHGALVRRDGEDWDVDIGSKVWLIPDNIANTANVYDFIHATREGRLEAIWEVSARGHYN